MTTREALDVVLSELPDDRLGQLLDFARYLSSQSETEAWQQFGRSQLAKAYGPDEPEPTLSREQWAHLVRELAGSITDPTFRRYDQGEFEKRSELFS